MFTWRSKASARGVRKRRSRNRECQCGAGSAKRCNVRRPPTRHDALVERGGGVSHDGNAYQRISKCTPVARLSASKFCSRDRRSLPSHLHNTSTNSTLSLSQQERNQLHITNSNVSRSIIIQDIRRACLVRVRIGEQVPITPVSPHLTSYKYREVRFPRHKPLSSCQRRTGSLTSSSPLHPFLLRNFPHRDCQGRTRTHSLLFSTSSKITTSVIIFSSTIYVSTSTYS